jgi:hydrogenase expression/formation protein HypE
MFCILPLQATPQRLMTKLNPQRSFEGPSCPLPLHHGEQIIMGHGSGGRLTNELIQRVFLPTFTNPALLAGNDFASLGLPAGEILQGTLAVSTDSHIITPLFFPGGDIGRLAVCGTVNDVSMSGAKPLYLTAGFILEEENSCLHASCRRGGRCIYRCR